MNENLLGVHKGDASQVSDWNSLSIEIRLMIWRLAYTMQGPRLVEIQTLQHDHYKHPHIWCPRYSPSPPPTIINVCKEAREEARKEARKAGHLLFATSPDASEIYFNPEIDILYIRNEKEYWIRDWGSEGVLTQYKKDQQPELLRHLAIELDPINRATTRNALGNDLKFFRALEDITFVVKEPSTEIFEWIKMLDRSLRFHVRDRREGRTRPYPEGCTLAIKRGPLLEVIETA